MRQPRGRLGVVSATLAAVVCLLVASVAHGQAVATVEEVEAAYLHKFTGYVDWPVKVLPAPGTPITVGVAGSDRMYELLVRASQGRPVQGRVVDIRRVTNVEQAAQLQLVFVGKDAWKDLPAWVAAAKDHALVITTDAPEGVDRGATLGFVQAGRQVRFEASLTAADKAGVKLSSRLLGVADRVVGSSP